MHLQPQAGQCGGEKVVSQDQRSWRSCAVKCSPWPLLSPPLRSEARRKEHTPDSTWLCRLSLSCSQITERGLLRGTVILGSRNPLCIEGERAEENSWSILPPLSSTGKCITTTPMGAAPQERKRCLARRIQHFLSGHALSKD